MTNKNQIRRNKFIRMFFMSLAAFSVIAALVTTVYVLVAKNNLLSKVLQTPVLKTEAGKPSAKDKAFTVISIFGVDQMDANYTEDAMLLFFNHKNQNIHVVSIPRDTKFNWPEDVYKELSSKRKDIPKIISIHDVPMYTPIDKKDEISLQVLQNAFQMNVDYYVRMDLAAFKYVVELIGPIPFDVPMDLQYVDAKKGIEVNLIKGKQELDADQAGQLVSYHSKHEGIDVNRIRLQQDFFKAYVAQMLKPQNKINIPSIMKGLYPYIKTNFTNASDYLVYLEDISTDKIFLSILPGDITSDQKYVYDSLKAKEMFETILASKLMDVQEVPVDQPAPAVTPEPKKPEESSVQVMDVFDVKIMPIGVYNGTEINGLAAKTKEKLTAMGYKVVNTGNHSNKPVQKTIIKAYAREIGAELQPLFKDSIVQLDESLKGAKEEIIIILGLSEKP